MATKAKTTAKSKTKSASARKTTARAVTSSRVVSSTRAVRPVNRLASITPQALIAEAVGTFGLALAALTAPADQPLLVGLALAVMLVGLMRVSGGHFNPAVTFGLWAANKVEGIKVPFFWVAQFIGGLAALVVLGWFNGSGNAFDMSAFAKFDAKTFGVELVGTALFLMGIVAVLKNSGSVMARSAGIGLSLTVGLVVAGGLLTASSTNEQTLVQSGKQKTVSQTFAAQGPALNPAIALGQTQRDVEAINKSISGEGEANAEQKKPSHFTVNTIFGSLVGAAIGTNLYLLIAGLSWKAREL